MLPSCQLLEKIGQEITNIPNQRKESKRKIHYGLFLLGYQSGLRISEAVNFDLTTKNKHGLYRLEKPKGKKERFVYIPKQVIRELRKNNWQPNQTNRWNFYHFLKKVKRELGISKSIELTPHTLRCSFATYQAESGLPLLLLQKLLGHSSIRTTALYWQDIYQAPNNDLGSILTAKNWLEKKNPPKSLRKENFPEVLATPKPVFIDRSQVIPNKKSIQQDNYLSTKKTTAKSPSILINKISPFSPEKFSLNNTNKKSDQLEINQQLALIPNQREKLTAKELILLAKIKQLEKQLKQTQELAEKEKKRADQAKQQLQKIEQERTKIQAQIIQPLPWKPAK